MNVRIGSLSEQLVGDGVAVGHSRESVVDGSLGHCVALQAFLIRSTRLGLELVAALSGQGMCVDPAGNNLAITQARIPRPILTFCGSARNAEESDIDDLLRGWAVCVDPVAHEEGLDW